MTPIATTARLALNKAFLKVKPTRADIERFKTNLRQLLDHSNDAESEEFHKNLLSDFLKKTWYEPRHFINTKGRNDLVIHNGDQARSSVGVILEAKKPTNKTEMPTPERLNVKAFQELVLYYLRERISGQNLEVKRLIITNIYEWYIFDATLFDRFFAQNKAFVKQFQDFEEKRLADSKTDFFYRQIAEPFIRPSTENCPTPTSTSRITKNPSETPTPATTRPSSRSTRCSLPNTCSNCPSPTTATASTNVFTPNCCTSSD